MVGIEGSWGEARGNGLMAGHYLAESAMPPLKTTVCHEGSVFLG